MMQPEPSLRAKRSNPEQLAPAALDYFVAPLLAMTMSKISHMHQPKRQAVSLTVSLAGCLVGRAGARGRGLRCRQRAQARSRMTTHSPIASTYQPGRSIS